MAAFAGDSLALGPHWDYNPEHIRDTHGRVDRLLPPAKKFHQGKEAGDFTHYGDQTLVLLESVAAVKGFDLQDFFTRWRALFKDYDGYVDGATRMTLQRIEFGEGPESSGSNSNDLAGASRIGPLFAALHDDPKALIAAAKAQTAMTHAHPDVVWAAEFFARAVLKALAGTEPVAAMQAAAAELPADAKKIVGWVEDGLSMLSEDPVKATAKFGSTCHVNEAFPATVQSVAHSPNDLKNCLVDCVMAGGDSAARAMLAGMLVAAFPDNGGLQAIPQDWRDGLKKKDAILGALNTLT
jgi:ADP-ribosylglycohydrolase